MLNSTYLFPGNIPYLSSNQTLNSQTHLLPQVHRNRICSYNHSRNSNNQIIRSSEEDYIFDHEISSFEVDKSPGSSPTYALVCKVPGISVAPMFTPIFLLYGRTMLLSLPLMLERLFLPLLIYQILDPSLINQKGFGKARKIILTDRCQPITQL